MSQPAHTPMTPLTAPGAPQAAPPSVGVREYVRDVHIAEADGLVRATAAVPVAVAKVLYFDGERVGEAAAWVVEGGSTTGVTLYYEVPIADLTITPEPWLPDPSVVVHRVQVYGRDVLTPPLPWAQPGTVDLSGGARVTVAMYAATVTIGTPPPPDDDLDAPVPPADGLTVYRDQAGEWRWRLQAPNRRVIADSGEGYESKAFAVVAAERATMRVVGQIIESAR